MPIQDETTPLANLCQKAGSTLDEVLALEECELEELSKVIVGNGVLDHARVIRQWRRCRLEEDLRKEIEVELANEGQEEEEEEQRSAGEVQEEVLDAVDTSEEPHTEDVIGESWQEYLRKQIRVEMEEIKPPPVTSVVASPQTAASGFTEDCDSSEEDYETFMTSITLDQSLFESSEEEEDDDEEDVKTAYNPVMAVGYAASDIMGAIEDGLSTFLEPNLPKEKPKKKPPKSFFETGMDYFYPEEPKESSKNKKKKSKPKIGGLGFFFDDSGANKENNKKKKSMKARSKTMSRRRKKKEQSQQQDQAYKLVPAKPLPLSRFRC